MASAGTDKPTEPGAFSTTAPVLPTTSDSSSSVTQPPLAERTQLAAAEGHDADIPSNIGYVLDEEGKKRRRESISRQRRESEIARQSTRGSNAEDVEKRAAAEDGTEVEDENVVWWDRPDDPENPLNWPSSKKIMTCALVSLFTFVTPLASCKSSTWPTSSTQPASRGNIN